METERLEQLMNEEKWEEARALLRDYLNTAPTEEERGEYFVQIASVYLRVMNKINEQYASLLDDSVEMMRQFNTREGEMQKQGDIQQAKDQLEDAYKN